MIAPLPSPQLWDLGAGRLLHDFTEHTSAVTSLAFHPMELLLATGSLDRTVKFWDVERLCQVSEAPVEASGIRCVQFHPEGQCLFSGSQDFLKVSVCTGDDCILSLSSGVQLGACQDAPLMPSGLGKGG